MGQRWELAASPRLRAAVDSELVLHAEHIGIVKVQEFRRAPVGIQLLFLELEAHSR